MKYDKEQIKELILTDYIDGQLDEKARKEMDAAIARDPKLQEFLAAVRQNAHEPFESLPPAKVPEHVWLNIKDKIEATQQAHEKPLPVLDGFLEQVQAWWTRPRLSLALGSAMAMVLVFMWVGVGRYQGTHVRYNKEKQVEYLMFLADGDAALNGEDITDFDTTIENYFL